MSQVTVSIKKLPNLKELPLPSYATLDSAGLDLMAAIEEPITLNPLERRAVPTGIAIALPKGFEAQVRPRSGLALKHGISVPNAPGTIDADYRGEVCAILINLSNEPFVIERGMRIAQMVIAQHSQADWNIVETLDETARGASGFGSTGVSAKQAA
ncbi:MAG: dUTP diphosphatase [Alphaproteobacteria bacterium]|jgi:dUTP pyrophosphatase|nr:dUTP diphosphatase [Candidatus Jidaibacter sp.]